MNKKLPFLIGVGWLLIAVALYGYCIWDDRPDGVYTYENDGCTTGQTVYVTDNDKTCGYIYKMDLYGKIQKFFNTQAIGEDAVVREIAYQDGVYAVVELLHDGSSATPEYMLLELDEQLKLLRTSPVIQLYELDRLTDLSLDEEGIYLTAVATDGGAASVYRLQQEQLAEEQEREVSLQAESFLRKECDKGRIYVDASYVDQAISVRTDADLVSGAFALDDSIRYIYAQCSMSVGQLMRYHSSYALWLVAAIVAGWLVIALLRRMFHNRNRFVYTAVVMELVLAAVVFGGTSSVLVRQSSLEQQTDKKQLAGVMSDLQQKSAAYLAGVSQDGFYDSTDYETLMELLKNTRTAADGCEDLFFTDLDEYRICVSASGKNQELAGRRYFGAANEQLLQSLTRQGQVAAQNLTYNGREYLLMVHTPTDASVNSGYSLFALFERDGVSTENRDRQMVYALLMFILASMLCMLILVLQASDFDRLAKSMQLVAKGRTDLERPRIYGRDMRMVWSALGEIQKTIRSVNYSKYLTFEAYYRFAPKNIEKLLKKESITEVESGNVVRLSGTMTMISTAGAKSGSEQEISRLNRLLDQIGRYQEEKDGVFISNDGALSMLRFLFMEQNCTTIGSTVNFLKELEESEEQQNRSKPRTAALLHYSSFVYGIAGTMQQSSAFLVSQDTEEIERFAAWFREHGLKLVISETVLERESYDGEVRCIGYIQLNGNGKKVNMYEVLDVYGANERARKLELRSRFEEALQLFYQHDFYLARSAFSDVLKELPTDEIAKWYLFTCESYLNMEHAEELPCGLDYGQ